MKKILLRILQILLGIYLIICGLLYVNQEKLIFIPQKLDKTFQFQFETPYEEIFIRTRDDSKVHGLLFRAQQSKGLIFYLHGNAGSLASWGAVAKTYTDLNYDVFMLDYRGYGKSDGEIVGEEQLFEDNQAAYEELKKKYPEDQIIILGYSIGTGMAAQLASVNRPKLLILQAPYYSLTDMMKHTFSFVPTFLLKYKFATHAYLKQCKMPVVIFHGNRDEVIYYGSSLKLQQEFKQQDVLITLDNQGHNGMTDNPEYRKLMKRILAD
ncbi:MAG: alpha/beta fold hydrolase [Cyclobacteriaceae bacterium]|nr:alpha/beta fold hydrolase [Cyclobacteriaceae bacterium]